MGHYALKNCPAGNFLQGCRKNVRGLMGVMNSAKFPFYACTLLLLCMFFSAGPALCQDGGDKAPPGPPLLSGDYSSGDLGISVKAPKGWNVISMERLEDKLDDFDAAERPQMEKKLQQLKDAGNQKEYDRLRQSLDNMDKAAQARRDMGDRPPVQTLFLASRIMGKSRLSLTCRLMRDVKKDYLAIRQAAYVKSGFASRLRSVQAGGITWQVLETSFAGKKDGGGDSLYILYFAPVKEDFLLISCTCPPGIKDEPLKFIKAINLN
jgi:hypothetical protein